jgi:hypothetical protein
VANAIQRVERAMLERAPRRYEIEALCERLESEPADPSTTIAPPVTAPS